MVRIGFNRLLGWQERDWVIQQLSIYGQQYQFVRERLGYQQSIKRVFMQIGQQRNARNCLFSYGQGDY